LIRPDRQRTASFAPEVDYPSYAELRADPKRHGVRAENVVATISPQIA